MSKQGDCFETHVQGYQHPTCILRMGAVDVCVAGMVWTPCPRSVFAKDTVSTHAVAPQP
jgi:hypothetical protein